MPSDEDVIRELRADVEARDVAFEKVLECLSVFFDQVHHLDAFRQVARRRWARLLQDEKEMRSCPTPPQSP